MSTTGVMSWFARRRALLLDSGALFRSGDVLRLTKSFWYDRIQNDPNALSMIVLLSLALSVLLTVPVTGAGKNAALCSEGLSGFSAAK